MIQGSYLSGDYGTFTKISGWNFGSKNQGMIIQKKFSNLRKPD